MLKNVSQLLLYTCSVYGIFLENFSAKRLLTSHHIISYHIGHYNWIWASWKLVFTNCYNYPLCEVLLRKLMIFIWILDVIFFIFWGIFSQKIKNHLCKRKSRLCEWNETIQSLIFYHPENLNGKILNSLKFTPLQAYFLRFQNDIKRNFKL